MGEVSGMTTVDKLFIEARSMYHQSLGRDTEIVVDIDINRRVFT